MKKQLLLLAGTILLGAMTFGQEMIQNGDFELPDDGKKYSRIDSIPGWLTDDETADANGREFVETNGVAWHWDGAGGIYQVIGTVPSTTTRYDFSFDATCYYSWWSGDYVTDVYVIFSAFAGEDPSLRVSLDTVKFTVSCIGTDYNQWVTKTGVYEVLAGNQHAGEHLVFEIEIYDSRLFGYDESWTYLHYDNVSVYKIDATSVVNIKEDQLRMVSYPGMISITGENTIESVAVYDLTGRRILEVIPNSDEVTLKTGRLNHGIYLISMKMNGERFTKKMVL
jgi:hypothetical protein